MNTNTAIIACAIALLHSGSESVASEAEPLSLEELVEASVLAKIGKDSREEQVHKYAASLAQEGTACFREKTRHYSERETKIFGASISRYDNVFQIDDWGTSVVQVVESEYKLKRRDWKCEEGESPVSNRCAAARSFLNVSMGMFQTFLRCLTDSIPTAKGKAAL